MRNRKQTETKTERLCNLRIFKKWKIQMLIKNVLFHHFFLKFLLNVDNTWMKNIKSFATVKILTNFETLEYFIHFFRKKYLSNSF